MKTNQALNFKKVVHVSDKKKKRRAVHVWIFIQNFKNIISTETKIGNFSRNHNMRISKCKNMLLIDELIKVHPNKNMNRNSKLRLANNYEDFSILTTLDHSRCQTVISSHIITKKELELSWQGQCLSVLLNWRFPTHFLVLEIS